VGRVTKPYPHPGRHGCLSPRSLTGYEEVSAIRLLHRCSERAKTAPESPSNFGTLTPVDVQPAQVRENVLPHRVLVSGSLSFDDYELLTASLDRILAGKQNILIISGGATGAEALGERYAQDRGCGVRQFLADWKLYGRGAKVIRNTQMIEVADRAVFFWDGKNKGVAEMIEKAEAIGIPVEVVRFG
jgi:hypothetical protein